MNDKPATDLPNADGANGVVSTALFGDLVLSDKEANEQECRCVVRLRRSWWHDPKGLHQRIDLTYLKRHCKDFNILDEDACNCGADEVLLRVVNLDECKDGIYEVLTCNERRDWETGYIDEYDYRLVPYSPNK